MYAMDSLKRLEYPWYHKLQSPNAVIHPHPHDNPLQLHYDLALSTYSLLGRNPSPTLAMSYWTANTQRRDWLRR